MGLMQDLSDLKAHLESGAEWLASKLPGALDLAQKLESDPLVSTVLSTTLGPTGKQIVTDLIGRLEQMEAEAEQAKQQAAADAAAAAAAPPVPAGVDAQPAPDGQPAG